MKKALTGKDDDYRHLLTALRVSLGTLGLAWIEEVFLFLFVFLINKIFFFKVWSRRRFQIISWYYGSFNSTN